VWFALTWLLVLAGAAGIVLAAAAGLGAGGRTQAGAVAQAALLAGSTLALALYVASEDDYRRGGISRWEAYDAQELTTAALSTGAAAAVGLVLARDGRGWLVAASLASTVAAALQFAALFANSLN
jgi:hypothetical protein